MNFNKSFLSKYTLLQISNKSFRFKILSSNYKHFIRRPSKPVFKEYNKVLSHPISFSFYSSVANEEQIKTNNLDPAITVPSLQFPDVTFEPSVSHTDLCHALQICDSIEEQMLALPSMLSLSPEDIENRINFSKVIESLLKPFFGEIKIQLFGSTLNGFGFKGCDIDMSFETFADPKDRISYLEAPDVPLVSEVMSGKVSPAEVSLLPPKEQLIFIHSIMLEFYKESESPTIFINAHVPLIRFYHDKFGLKCDLTCQNKVAFSNTKLLYLFGRLDERVIPLLMTIRYWAKHAELIGKGLMFNTYTISLLAIHFLQTRKHPILPSAEFLMSFSDSLGIQDMNDNSFLELQKNVPESQNKQSLSELIKEFFFYYLYFDFSRVICPLIGDSVPREEFFSKSSRKFRMNSICVQDPMDISHNVAELVDFKHCKKFFTEIMVACRLFQDGSDLIPGPMKWGISCLLDRTDEYLEKYHKWGKKISFELPHIRRQVIKDTVNKDTRDSTVQTLLFLLEHVLLFECKPLEKSEVIEKIKQHDAEVERKRRLSEIKNQYTSELIEKKKIHLNMIDLQQFSNALMLEEFQKFSSENELVACFECKAVKNSWLGRDHISVDSLPNNISNNLIEKEHYISLEASNQNEIAFKMSIKDTKIPMKKIDPFVFFCECYVSSESADSLLLNFRPFLKSNFNPVLGIFLKEYLPWLMKNLNEDC